MSKNSNDIQPLFKQADYIVIEKDWKTNYIFKWEDGIKYLSAIRNAIVINGELDLSREGKVSFSEMAGSESTIRIQMMSEEHLQALYMKSLVTKED